MVKTASLALASFALLGCASTSTEAVRLAHPDTPSEVVQCGPYAVSAMDKVAAGTRARARSFAYLQLRDCIEDYQRQGYRRVPEANRNGAS